MCEYIADTGKHQASMQGRAETTTWRKDLANRLHVSYIHACAVI